MSGTQVLNGHRPSDVLTAARLISDGGVVAIPTDTVYGLAAGVFHEDALQRIFRIKERPAGQPMPILLATASDVTLVATGVPREAWPLIERFWPGPLTLVLPARSSLSTTVRAGGTTVAVRVPAGATVLRFLESVAEPVTGTSANLHGVPAAVSAEDVAKQFPDQLDAILTESRPVPIGSPSSVVEIRGDSCIVHRRGAVSVDELRQALGPRVRVQG